MAYNNAPDLLTIAEIERYGRDPAALAELRQDNHEAWSEVVCFLDDIDSYRRKRLKRRDTNLARNVIKPVPQAAPPVSRLNREDAGMLCRGIAKAVRRFVEEKTNGLAAASRVAEIENQLRQENADLRRQIVDLQKRVASHDIRHDAVSRHVRNVEAKLTGGKVEKQP